MTDKRTGFPWPSRRAAVRGFIIAGCAALAAAVLLAAWLFLYVRPRLPELDVITDYQPKIPLRVYTADNVLIGEFGEEHRDFVPIAQVPEMMKKALLAIEDGRFYEHHGIDFVRAGGAVLSNLRHGFGHGGGSTITMQVARNFFLTREKVASRKLNEIMLALKIEAALSKDQILELYMNQMYLGQRSFGFGSAAQTYFGKPLSELSIAEMAMLAGLPQNPSRHNPISNPKKAHARQQLVLKRMRELDYISEGQYRQALAQPLHINTRGKQGFDTHAEYVAELARQAVFAQFKEGSYTKGISVYTTILKADQDAAYASTRRNVIAYDQRHGYRGPETFIDMPLEAEQRDDAIDAALQKRPDSDGLIAAVVTEVVNGKVIADTGDGDAKAITGDGLRFAAPALSAKASAGIKLRPGAVIRITQDAKGNWAITQVPLVAAAFVSLDAETGAYHAMVGGFDYNLQKFNHVTQAWRQPGSAMKPFVYSAALEKGFSPATLINDAPLEMQAGGKVWAPQNDDFKFDGPITMRYALAQSKNVASVRILRALGVSYTHDFMEKFGFDPARQPSNLTMALGTGSVTPVQMAGAYALFANGGHQVEPYLIDRIVDAKGAVLMQTKPPAPNDDKTLALDPRNAFVMDSMLREVARTGTGAAATKKLGRSDIAGKTGTTSDAVDGWFAGYGGGIVAVAWMGYDEPKSLGGREFGSTLAMPIWIDYMRTALSTRPQITRAVPAGLSQVDGEWQYDEFIDMNGVKTLDMDMETPTDPAAVPETVPPETTN
ncbi:penicillin-binding protein 1A [Janthinobacterium sp. BJB446]|uniref:penicillin-binding protein 1A n=1 Tax=Janthinobacterium sp. BJB446 TaxID=2048009 RepID=UPI00211E2119|nr:PBP1A family penicillin-binding protein [Janthinobacterium sp. BJB446]